MASQFQAENLTPGTSVFVNGLVAFSHIAKPFTGEALQRRIKQSRGLYPTMVEHTTIDLKQANVKTMEAEPNYDENFVAERTYVSKKTGERHYSIDNRGTQLPTVFRQDADNPGQYVQEVNLKGEIAVDTPVTLQLTVYESKDEHGRVRPKKGLGLQAIYVHATEVPYYQPASRVNTDAAAKLGLVLGGGPIQPTTSDLSNQPDAPEDDPNAGLPGINSDGSPGTLPQPSQQTAQPQQQVQPAPQAFAQSNQAQQAQAQPQQPQAQAAPGAFAQPQAQQAQPQAQQPTPQGQSAFDGAPHNQGGGISFDGIVDL